MKLICLGIVLIVSLDGLHLKVYNFFCDTNDLVSFMFSSDHFLAFQIFHTLLVRFLPVGQKSVYCQLML